MRKKKQEVKSNGGLIAEIFHRVRWSLLLAIIFLMIGYLLGLGKIAGTFDTARLISYKITLVCLTPFFVHFIRRIIFPYIYLEELLKHGDPLKFLGACILIGLLTLALVLGFVMGI